MRYVGYVVLHIQVIVGGVDVIEGVDRERR